MADGSDGAGPDRAGPAADHPEEVATDPDAPDRRPFVVDLAEPDARRPALAGGKAATLARLVDAGFPVPPGFCVTTAAFRALVDDPAIAGAVRTLDALDPTDAEAIAAAGADLREAVRDRELPGAVRRDVESALAALDADAVAVRSSATAEDLPTASFAGQHETFLAVRGPDAVADRVRECMASLFTDRAVAYRLRNGVPSAGVAMAVVVQAMVEPDVAGVCFTADPVTGNRHVASIDASYGLGDAVVAGEVSPDAARVDRRTGEVLAYEVGEKRHAVRSRPDAGGGTETVTVEAAERSARALADDQLRDLVELGGSVEALLGRPQDVEWALVGVSERSSDGSPGEAPDGGEFVVLQSRPITSLYPLPAPPPVDDRLHVYLSFGHQQAMPAALPPLVVDFWRGLLDGAAGTLRSRPTVTPAAVEAGGRVYMDVTPLLGVGALRRTVPSAVDAMSEPAADGLRALLEARPASFPVRGRVAGAFAVARALRSAAPVYWRAAPRLVAGIVRSLLVGPPDLAERRADFEGAGARMAARVEAPGTVAGRARAALEAFHLGEILARVAPLMGPFPAAIVARKLLERLVPGADDEDLAAVGRGFELEIVTRINQRLGDLADRARDVPGVASAIEAGATLDELRAVEGGAPFAAAFEAFLDDFGHRATGEIDLGRPRWREDPAPLFRTMRGSLARDEPGTHREHLRDLERRADAAADRLEARAARGPLGPVRRRLVRRLLRTYRGGIQLREYPKQGVAHLFRACRDALREAGGALADDGRLERADDVWFLRREELLAPLATGAPVDADVAARRRAHERHAAMVAPPLLTSEGEQPTAASPRDAPEGALVGTPVSAGVVEGPARVVLDPAETTVERGEVIVAPACDPGWTPLFLNAAGLVMEVGGRMTHGALVAREYGLPGVASVAAATTTIRTGERLRVDGTRGTVERLDRA